MPLEQTDAIVLRVIPWSETSVISTLYTRDFGKVGALAKGARRPKSPFEAALDLLSVCRVVFISKSNDSLDILTEAKLQRRFRAGSRELLRLYAGYYVAELLDRMTDKGDKQPELFELALATLEALANRGADLRAVVLRFELQLLKQLGHQPIWDRCAQCGGNVAERPWMVFGALAGGVLCEGCQAGARQMIRVPRDVREPFECFGDANWRKVDVSNYPENHRAAIRGLTQKYLTTLLDRKLLLHAYLEELGR